MEKTAPNRHNFFVISGARLEPIMVSLVLERLGNELTSASIISPRLTDELIRTRTRIGAAKEVWTSSRLGNLVEGIHRLVPDFEIAIENVAKGAVVAIDPTSDIVNVERMEMGSKLVIPIGTECIVEFQEEGSALLYYETKAGADMPLRFSSLSGDRQKLRQIIVRDGPDSIQAWEKRLEIIEIKQALSDQTETDRLTKEQRMTS